MQEENPTPVPTSRVKMPAQVFKDLWIGGDIDRNEWKDCVRYESWGEFLSIVFLNVDVEGNIAVSGEERLPSHLKLLNCKLPDLRINRTEIRSISTDKGSEIQQLIIDSSKAGRLIIESTTITNLFIRFDSKTDLIKVSRSKIGRLYVSNSFVDGIQIQYESVLWELLISDEAQISKIEVLLSTIEDNLGKRGFLSNAGINISNSKIGGLEVFSSEIGDCKILNSQTGDFKISDKSTIGNFHFIENPKIGSIQIENSKTKEFRLKDSNTGNFRVSENSETGSFLFEKSTAGDFRIKNSSIESILVMDSRMKELVVTYASFRRIEIIKNSFVKRFRCRIPLQSPAQITFEKSSFEEMDFDKTILPEFTALQLINCQIDNLFFRNFCNFGAVFFSDLKVLNKNNPLSTLRLADSDLGKTQFVRCDLTEFQQFEFANTKMLEAFVADSKMPNGRRFCLPPDTISDVNEQKRLAYGQFKKIYEARGDIAGSLRYLAFEMDAYFLQLIRKKPGKVGELIMLGLNKISTNYGNNWGQGALVTFFMICACYAIFCYLIGFRLGNDWDSFWRLACYAPQYLNPFRDADSVIPDKFLPHSLERDGYGADAKKILPELAIVWDYISRVIVTYFVYQTIQAFRKLGKSSG